VEASEGSEPLPGKCRDWRAQQPPGVGKLMVGGWCTLAEYVEETDIEYDTVTILPHGPTIEVEKGA
jgi:hypothetical protein